jgi:hypothetical protein
MFLVIGTLIVKVIFSASREPNRATLLSNTTKLTRKAGRCIWSSG